MKNKLKEYRIKEGLTQEELAKKSGVSRTTISALENETLEVVTNITLQKLANALNKKVSTIFLL